MKQFFHSLFYLPKHEKLTDRSFMKIVISSIAGITLCCLCLMSLTWAWFEDSSSSDGNFIKSASFWAEVCIEKIDTTKNIDETDETENDGETDEPETEPASDEQPSEDGEGEVVIMRSASPYLLTSVPVIIIEDSSLQLPMYFVLEDGYTLKNLEAGDYKISVYPRGTAEKVGGYIVIKAEGKDTLYTEQLTIGEEFVFILSVDGSVDEYDFFCVWGSLPSDIAEEYILKNEPDAESYKDDSSADSSDTSSDVSSADENTSSVESDVVSSVGETESTDISSVESEVVSSSEESESSTVNSVESEVVSSSEESENSTVNSVESEVVNSSEESENSTVNSVESEVVSSEAPEETSSQEGFEDVTIEESSSEI